MKFKVEFEMDNAAFGADRQSQREEVERILKELAAVQFGYSDGRVRDSNGNTVGKWEIVSD